MASEAADFVAWTVKPTESEFLSNPRNIRFGQLAAMVLNHMVDYLALEGYVGVVQLKQIGLYENRGASAKA